MRQLSLTYDAGSVGAADWDTELGWFRRAVEVVGAKEVAFRLDVQASHLSDAMHERERKNVHGRWISVVRHMVPEVMLAEHLALICGLNGYDAPKRKEPKNDRDARRAERAWLREHAPALLEMMDREVG